MRRHLSVVPDLPPSPAEIHQERALPAAWDGRDVQWGHWTRDTTAALHMPVAETACTDCGGLSGVRQCSGTYWAEQGAVIHAAGLRRLIASRCRDCGTDRVCEMVPGSTAILAVWDLEPSDYGPDGSWPTGQGTLL